MPICPLDLGNGVESDAWLWAGGWTRDAMPRKGWAVIDLTGDRVPRISKVESKNDSGTKAFASTIAEAKKVQVGPWLSLPIKDYDIPTWDREVWDALSVDVANLLLKGTNVLVACVGGHGRTGLAVAVLGGILRPDLFLPNPIKVLREEYCKEVVETRDQVDYVFDVLGLPRDPDTKPAEKTSYGGYGGGGYYTGSGVGTVWDSKTKSWVQPPSSQPSGSNTGPSKDESPKALVPTPRPILGDSDPKTGGNGDSMVQATTPEKMAALDRLCQNVFEPSETEETLVWESDDGRIVDELSGMKFTWEEITAYYDYGEVPAQVMFPLSKALALPLMEKKEKANA